MLDSGWHQGSGLRWHAQGVRALGIIPSTDTQDLQALWQLCAQLQHQGYPVLILDGTERETPHAPGLQDLLQGQIDAGFSALPADLSDPLKIASLPAARGLVQLAHLGGSAGQPPLHGLHRYVRNHAVILVLAPAALLAKVLDSSAAAPWLLVPAQRQGMLASYRALKHVFMHTGLMPQLLALRSGYTRTDPLLKSIAQCAQRHLRSTPQAWQIDPQQPAQLQQWSLQCLEQAQALHPTTPRPVAAPMATGAFAHTPAWNH